MTPDHLIIRVAGIDDYDLVLPLFLGLRELSRANHPTQTDDFGVVLDSSREYLREVLRRDGDAVTLLAMTGTGAVAGYLVATVREPNPLTSSGAVRTGSIDELFVDEASRGSGAGQRLMDAAFDWLREQRAERVEVGAYTWNTPAITFYERYGFRPWTLTLQRDL